MSVACSLCVLVRTRALSGCVCVCACLCMRVLLRASPINGRRVSYSVVHLELSDHGGIQCLAHACSHALTHVRCCMQLVALFLTFLGIIGITCYDSIRRILSRAISGECICARVGHDSRRHLFGLSTSCHAFSWQFIIDWPWEPKCFLVCCTQSMFFFQ
jgi:hypothetical protein